MKTMVAFLMMFLCVAGTAMAEDKAEFFSRTIIGPFGQGRSDADSRIKDQIRSFVSNLPERYMVVVEGYATASGSEEVNQKLSKERAQKVADYLRSIEPNIGIVDVIGNIYKKENKDPQVNETIVRLLVFIPTGEKVTSADLKTDLANVQKALAQNQKMTNELKQVADQINQKGVQVDNSGVISILNVFGSKTKKALIGVIIFLVIGLVMYILKDEKESKAIVVEKITDESIFFEVEREGVIYKTYPKKEVNGKYSICLLNKSGNPVQRDLRGVKSDFQRAIVKLYQVPGETAEHFTNEIDRCIQSGEITVRNLVPEKNNAAIDKNSTADYGNNFQSVAVAR